MFKYSKDLVPLPIVELFTRNYEFHNHFTRQSQSLHTAVGRNKAIYKTFTFHGIRIWNYISTKISVDVSFASFKHSSKLFIKNNPIPYSNLVTLLCYLVLLQLYVIFISYAYLSIFHTNLYVNIFNVISFSTFMNRVLQLECIILKFNSCLLPKISSRSP